MTKVTGGPVKNALQTLDQPYWTRFEYEGRNFAFEHPSAIDHIGKCQTKAKTFYELPLLEELRARLEDRKGIVIDVGAHVGNHTVYFAAVMGRTVIAIEPNPRVLPSLARNVLVNGVEDRVTILGCAAGRADWYDLDPGTPDSNTGMQRVVFDLHKGGHVPIELDYLTEDRNIVALLKIDVEGAECEALFSAFTLLTRPKHVAPLIAMEAQDTQAFDAQKGVLAGFAAQGTVTYTPSDRSWGSTPVYIWTPT